MRTRRLTQREFRIIAATTLGYYLVRDVVKRTWARRAAQTAVVAAGGAVLVSDEWKALSDKERGEVRESLVQVRENLGTNAVPGIVAAVAAPVAGVGTVLGVGAWLNGRVDAAGAAVVTRTVGRLPLVGGLFRALSSTTYGVVQVGVLYVVNERVQA